MPLAVQRRPAVELPGQQGPADASSPEVGAHPALEIHRQRVAEGGCGHHGGVRDEQTRRVAHRQAVARGIDAPPAPPLGDVLGVGVLARVVDLLGGREKRGDGDRVVVGQWAGGQPVGQHGKGVHACGG
jgi:hypothetical protein